MLRLYKTLIRPHVEYCTSTWSPYYVKDKELIEKLQHRFTKLIPEVANLSYFDRLHRLGLWNLEERRNRAYLAEVFKMIRGLSLLPFTIFLTLIIPIAELVGTRSLKLIKHRFALSICQHFFSDRVINRWNSLDNETVKSVSLNCFKSRLTKLRLRRMDLFMD